MEQSTCRFHIVTYLESDEILAILSEKDCYIKEAVIINHDSDENEPHRHLILNLLRSRTIEQIIGWFKIDDRNTFARKNTYSRTDTIKYLLHINEASIDDGKHVYNTNEIICYKCDITEWLNDSRDNSFIILTAMIEGTSYIELAKRFGKDFIYHYRNYKELSELIRLEQKTIYSDLTDNPDNLPV